MKSHTISSIMLSFGYIYSGFHYAVRAEVINSSSTEDSATCSAQGIGVFILVSMSQLM